MITIINKATTNKTTTHKGYIVVCHPGIREL